MCVCGALPGVFCVCVCVCGALPGAAETQAHHRVQGLLPQGAHSMGKWQRVRGVGVCSCVWLCVCVCVCIWELCFWLAD